MVLIIVLVSGFAALALACQNCGCQLAKAGGPADEHAASQAADAAPVNAGNTICPIMGLAVSVDSPDKVEYNGKIYNLCCPGCKAAFLKDPQAALKKLAAAEPAAASVSGK
jgi:YHS domain-containing protein